MKNINDIRKEKELYYVMPNEVVINREKAAGNEKILVVACLYYEELLEESLGYLKNVPDYMDICICTSNQAVVEKTKEFCGMRRNIFLVQKENRGRDISSLLVACKKILPQYDYICFIHDKKSIHALTQQRWEIDLWIKNLWSSVLDSEQYIENVLSVFAKNPEVGLLVPPEPTGDIMRNWYNNTWGPNFQNTVELSERLKLKCNISKAKPPFTIGTVFWCRYEALKKLFEYDWKYEDFPEEPMASDGTISHAIERILGYVAQDAGYDTGTVLTCEYAQYLISFAQNRLQEAFGVLENSYNLYDFNQLKLAKKAQRKYSSQVISSVKRFAKQYKRLYIYGAGIWAERIVEIIDNEGLELEGVLVTNLEENPSHVGNHKCMSLQEAIGGNSGIIIAVRNAQAVDEIQRKIDERGLFEYISVNELETGTELERCLTKSVSNSVKFSILMPVYNVDPIYLSRALKSVLNQSYRNWELCIVDDCSTDKRVRGYLRNLQDERFKIRLRRENGGISEATNAAAKMATGEYLLLMDNDDVLHSDALLKFYNEITKSSPDILYSDMDKVDENELHSGGFYKPQWSPDLMTAQMYMGHLLGFKRALFNKVGGFRTECNGSQDYDIVLRMLSYAKVIKHVDGVYYSWRLLPGSTALNADAKPYTQTAAIKAIQEYLDNRYGVEKAAVNETEWLHIYDITYDLPKSIGISVIVPLKSRDEVVLSELRKMAAVCSGKNRELILIGAVQKGIAVNGALVVPSKQSAWAELCNEGIKKSKGEVVIILDSNIEITQPDWIERLASNALREDVAVAGGLILDNEGMIENAGIRIDRNGWVYDMYAGLEPVQNGNPTISPLMTRNVTALSHKCMAFSRKVYNEIGGFKEDSPSAAVDFCVAALNGQRWNVYSPYVKMIDHGLQEEQIRQSVDMGDEMYKSYLEDGDPYYSNLLDETKSVPTVKA